MRLESGPAKADRNWQILRAVLFLGFALYFVYDGAIGYHKKNRVEAEKVLAVRPYNGEIKYEDLPETPTKPQFEKLVASNPVTTKDVRAALGEPIFVDGSDEYYMSRYGRAKVVARAGLVKLSDTNWQPWKKTREDIRQQFYWAIIPAIPGLYFLWRLYKAATLRVVIDDEGMVYDKRRIPFEKMTSLRDYNPKGWIDLYHDDDGAEKKLRLDNEKVMLFDDIVAAICQAKGFKNEVKEHADRQAESDAGDAGPDPAVDSDDAGGTED